MCFAVRMRIVHSLSSACEIGEAGAEAFVEVLKKNTTLQSLDISECSASCDLIFVLLKGLVL